MESGGRATLGRRMHACLPAATSMDGLRAAPWMDRLPDACWAFLLGWRWKPTQRTPQTQRTLASPVRCPRATLPDACQRSGADERHYLRLLVVGAYRPQQQQWILSPSRAFMLTLTQKIVGESMEVDQVIPVARTRLVGVVSFQIN